MANPRLASAVSPSGRASGSRRDRLAVEHTVQLLASNAFSRLATTTDASKACTARRAVTRWGRAGGPARDRGDLPPGRR
jgi:hypothetical protein